MNLRIRDIVLLLAGWLCCAVNVHAQDIEANGIYYNIISDTQVEVAPAWQAFQATYLDDHSALAVARCERIHKRLLHRPMSTNRETVDRFHADTASVVRNLIKEYPYLEQNPELQKVLDRS